MDIKNIETFLKVADLKNFTHAARELNYAQSTVTAQVQQLEAELGFPLFDRIGKHTSLTHFGHEFQIYANRIVQTMQQVYSIGKEPHEMSGVLRVGVLESLFSSTMIDVLPVYKSRYRNIEIQIQVASYTGLLSLLRENKVDMLYISGPPNSDPCFSSIYKREEQLIFVASPDHALAQKRSATLKEILMYDLIVTEQTGVCYTTLKMLASLYHYKLCHSLVLDNLNAISQALCKISGVSFLPEYSVLREIEQGILKKIYVDDIEPQIYYTQILHHRDKWIAPYMTGLVNIVCDIKPER